MKYFFSIYKNKYHQKHKEKVQKEACERYQNLSEEEKEKNGEKRSKKDEVDGALSKSI